MVPGHTLLSVVDSGAVLLVLCMVWHYGVHRLIAGRGVDQEREALLVEATSRFESGEAPTQEAVTMWRRHERSKLMAAEAAEQARQVCSYCDPLPLPHP